MGQPIRQFKSRGLNHTSADHFNHVIGKGKFSKSFTLISKATLYSNLKSVTDKLNLGSFINEMPRSVARNVNHHFLYLSILLTLHVSILLLEFETSF